MNQAKIDALKQISEVAHATLYEEQARLVAAGFKSAQRYVMLKDLKAAADKAHAEYSKYAKGQINQALCAIIAKQTPAERALGRQLARG